MADMLGAASADEIKFGANMTTLTFHVSRSIGAALEPGDEIVVTDPRSRGNVGPWMAIAADRGLTVRTVDIRADDVHPGPRDLDAVLGPRTKLVAVGCASNAVGTINPVAEIVRRAHAVGAWTYVDAVHAAPHVPIDVRALDTDFLACSTYKFFGPHAGRRSTARPTSWPRCRRTRSGPAYDRFETGTGNFEGLAGSRPRSSTSPTSARTTATRPPAPRAGSGSSAGMRAIRAYELDLYRRLADGLDSIDGLALYGITDRAPVRGADADGGADAGGIAPRAVAEALGAEGIAVWDGDFYATGLIERLGLADRGGVVRIGLTHYNTAAEVDRLVDALRRIAAGAASGVARTAVAAG